MLLAVVVGLPLGDALGWFGADEYIDARIHRQARETSDAELEHQQEELNVRDELKEIVRLAEELGDIDTALQAARKLDALPPVPAKGNQARFDKDLREQSPIWLASFGTAAGAALGFLFFWGTGRGIDWIAAGFQTNGSARSE